VSRNNLIRVFLAVEHPLVRRGIAAYCADHADVQIVAEAADGDSALRGIEATRPDVVVAHAALPIMNGSELIAAARRLLPEIKSMILVPLHDRSLMREAMASKADAFLLTTDVPQHVLRTVRMLHAGERFVCPLLAACSASLLNDAIPAHVREALNEEQLRLFQLILMQKNGSQIARALGLEPTEVAQLRVGICERLHSVPESGGGSFRPVEVLLPHTPRAGSDAAS
jgi:DNA-binding NarL/FixJ family response regulator